MTSLEQWITLLVGFSVVIGFATPIIRKIGEIIGQIVVVLQSHQNLVDKVALLAADLQKLTALVNELFTQLEKSGVLTQNTNQQPPPTVKQEVASQISKWS